jgi:hypothetical protein
MPRKTEIHKSPNFLWLPGKGPSKSDLSYLQTHAPRAPSQPPGEAWFIGEKRKIFSELIDQPVSEVPNNVITNFLYEVSSGVKSFRDATDEVATWKGWFKYLLPGLVARANECPGGEFLLEHIVTTFFQVYSDGLNTEDQGFRQDALDTVGTAIMMPALWDTEGESRCAQFQCWEFDGPLWPACSGAISASLCFCLTYLNQDQIRPWTESVLSIQSSYFRAHFLAWLVGADESVLGASSLNALDQATIRIDWAHSFLLKDSSPSIPEENKDEFIKTVRNTLNMEELLRWIDALSRFEELILPLESAKVPEYIADKILNGT